MWQLDLEGTELDGNKASSVRLYKVLTNGDGDGEEIDAYWSARNPD